MLEETLKEIIEKMKNYRSFYEQNEMAVRDQVVNPILRALGWNPENPDEVQPNVSMEEGIPDYALIKDKKEVLFIEAKKLSVDIEKRDVIRQLAKYCFGEGMKYGVLTNGAIWVLFRAFQPGTKMSERIVWRVDIENDGIIASMRKLNTISKDNINYIEKLIKKLQIMDEIWDSLVDKPEEIIKGLVHVFEKLSKEKYPEYEFEESEIEDFLRERVNELINSDEEIEDTFQSEDFMVENKHLQSMRIGNDTFEIRKFNEVLINTAEWLISKGKLKRSVCPIPAGRKRNLINTIPKHRNGKTFRVPRKLSNGLYIEVNYNANDCINNAKKLLEKFGYPKDYLKIYYE